jgi:four helix bundle protein
MSEHIGDFKDLEVWRLAMTLAEETYRLAATLPASERFELASQFRRSAVSIPSNIAEGYGRASRGDYVRFLRIANGSLKELETQVLLADRLDLLPSEASQPVLLMCGRVGQMLTVLRRRLAA